MDARECARTINEAMRTLPDGVALEARSEAGGVAVVLTISDEVRAPLDIKESRLTEELVSAACATTSDRFSAFLGATARWLGAQRERVLARIYPHEVFLSAALADARLTSLADFMAALEDPRRRLEYATASGLA